MEEIRILEIKEALNIGGISQGDIAKHLSLSDGAISSALSPSRNTGYKTLNKIIRAYNEITSEKEGEKINESI